MGKGKRGAGSSFTSWLGRVWWRLRLFGSYTWSFLLFVLLLVMGAVVVTLFKPGAAPGTAWDSSVNTWDQVISKFPSYVLETVRFLAVRFTELLSQGLAQFCTDHVAILLALMPSLLAFGYYALGRKRQLHARRETLLRYLRFRREFAASLSDGEAFFFDADTDDSDSRSVSKDRVGDELKAHRAQPLEYFFSALLLATPFLMLAAFSDSITHNSNIVVEALKYAALHEKGAPLGHLLEHVDEGIRGIVFTGYGVFTYTIVVLIHRIHASALSTEFLLSMTLRATLMMVIGFTIGLTGVFYSELVKETSNPGIFIYFVVGAFPSWGYEAIRGKARDVLKPNADKVNTNLSLEYVEGMDEPTIERLEEVNISNVQHLSTVDPVELTLKTLYPFHRVIDWIDQAILITYLREGIEAARRLGIRGAIDMRATFILARAKPVSAGVSFEMGNRSTDRRREPQDPTDVARHVLAKLAQETKLDPDAIYTIGMNLMYDFYVRLLGMLWHHYGVGKASLRPRAINAIHAAMKARGMQFHPEAPDGRLPDGRCLVKLDAKFEEALRKELANLTVSWDGRSRDLGGKEWLRDVYEAILRRIQVVNSEEAAVEAEGAGEPEQLDLFAQAGASGPATPTPGLRMPPGPPPGPPSSGPPGGPDAGMPQGREPKRIGKATRWVKEKLKHRRRRAA